MTTTTIDIFPTEILDTLFRLCVLSFDDDSDHPYNTKKAILDNIRRKAISSSTKKMISNNSCNDPSAIYRQEYFRIGASPWAISQTCRRWRAIALAMPTLWSHINLSINDHDTSQRVYTVLQMYLERSQDASLHIKVSYDHKAEHHPLLDLLVAHCHRWYAAELYVSVLQYPWVNEARGRCLRLHALSFSTLDDWGTWISPSEPPIETFATSSQLRSLSLNKHENVHSFHVRWDLLTHLEFQFFNINQLSFLLHTTNLRTCTFVFGNGHHSYDQDAFPNTPFELVHLRSLRLICEAGWMLNLKTLISCFRLPALEDLEISSPAGLRMPDLAEAIRTLVQRSGCSLKKFTFKTSQGELAPSPQLFQEMPFLEHLVIHGIHIKTLINHLTISSEHPPLIPMLRTLDISLASPTRFFDDRLLVDMIQSRVRNPDILDKPIGCLESFIFTARQGVMHCLSSNSLQRLDRLKIYLLFLR
jgi:hypothetical protein